MSTPAPQASPEDPAERPDAPAIDLARRRLLLVGGRYVAPAVLANLLMAQTANAQSCNPPANCPPRLIPCPPVSCNPQNKGN